MSLSTKHFQHVEEGPELHYFEHVRGLVRGPAFDLWATEHRAEFLRKHKDLSPDLLTLRMCEAWDQMKQCDRDIYLERTGSQPLSDGCGDHDLQKIKPGVNIDPSYKLNDRRIKLEDELQHVDNTKGLNPKELNDDTVQSSKEPREQNWQKKKDTDEFDSEKQLSMKERVSDTLTSLANKVTDKLPSRLQTMLHLHPQAAGGDQNREAEDDRDKLKLGKDAGAQLDRDKKKLTQEEESFESVKAKQFAQSEKTKIDSSNKDVNVDDLGKKHRVHGLQVSDKSKGLASTGPLMVESKNLDDIEAKPSAARTAHPKDEQFESDSSSGLTGKLSGLVDDVKSKASNLTGQLKEKLHLGGGEKSHDSGVSGKKEIVHTNAPTDTEQDESQKASDSEKDKSSGLLGGISNIVSSIKENVVGSEDDRLPQEPTPPVWQTDDSEKGGLDTSDKSFGIKEMEQSVSPDLGSGLSTEFHKTDAQAKLSSKFHTQGGGLPKHMKHRFGTSGHIDRTQTTHLHAASGSHEKLDSSHLPLHHVDPHHMEKKLQEHKDVNMADRTLSELTESQALDMQTRVP